MSVMCGQVPQDSVVQHLRGRGNMRRMPGFISRRAWHVHSQSSAGNPDLTALWTITPCRLLLPPGQALLPGVALCPQSPRRVARTRGWLGHCDHMTGVSSSAGAVLLPLALVQDCSCWGWGREEGWQWKEYPGFHQARERWKRQTQEEREDLPGRRRKSRADS